MGGHYLPPAPTSVILNKSRTGVYPEMMTQVSINQNKNYVIDLKAEENELLKKTKWNVDAKSFVPKSNSLKVPE